MSEKVVVYTQDICPSCRRTAEYLRQKGVPFVERNVLEDEQAMEELVEMGFFATPATVVDGEAVTGFDRRRLDDLLEGRG